MNYHDSKTIVHYDPGIWMRIIMLDPDTGVEKVTNPADPVSDS